MRSGAFKNAAGRRTAPTTYESRMSQSKPIETPGLGIADCADTRPHRTQHRSRRATLRHAARKPGNSSRQRVCFQDASPDSERLSVVNQDGARKHSNTSVSVEIATFA
jgi:hypothetical protein